MSSRAHRKQPIRATLAVMIIVLMAFDVVDSHAQFPLNFQPASGNVVGSIANQSCNFGGGGGGMMGGMMGGGNCGSTPFLQELVQINGANYYHVLVFDGADFSAEYYVRSLGGNACWFGCPNARVTGGGMMGGMGGMMGGAPAPLSASAGEGGLSGNNTDPLGAAGVSGNGTGRPDRTAMRVSIQTAALAQEFLKATESAKPSVSQKVTDGALTQDFVIDMSNSDYGTMATPGLIELSQTVNMGGGDPGIAFDIAGVDGQTNITGGRYTYAPGGGDGGSFGTYEYFADSFDVYSVDWESFCDPSQNPDSGCVNYGGGTGGGMMGGMGM